MKLSEYLTPDRVVILSGSTKNEALNEMIALLASADIGVGQDELAKAVWAREEMISTGTANSLAVPHVRLAGVRVATAAFGVSPKGIKDYKSLDSEPIHIIALIAAPAGEHETYVRLLAQVVEVLAQERLRRKIIDAPKADEVYRILTGGEA